jgi:predicted nucleotide-binding protein
VNGRVVAKRIARDHVCEMAAIQPTQRRSATVLATEDSVVCKLTEAQLTDLAQHHPTIWRSFARELAGRLEQRNAFVTSTRDKIRVFIICSAEALPIGRAIQNAFSHDSFLPVLRAIAASFWLMVICASRRAERRGEKDGWRL